MFRFVLFRLQEVLQPMLLGTNALLPRVRLALLALSLSQTNDGVHPVRLPIRMPPLVRGQTYPGR